MKIHFPNFVPKSGCFYQISVMVCPEQLPFSSFQGNFTTLLFVEVPVRNPPLSLISGFFTGKKVKNSTTCKKIRNWWNFNGIRILFHYLEF